MSFHCHRKHTLCLDSMHEQGSACEGCTRHVISYHSDGMHCSEPDCNINAEREYQKKMDELKKRSQYSYSGSSGDDYDAFNATMTAIIATMM